MFFVLGVSLAAYLLYTAVSAIWYIFFHPLRHVPGPKSWIVFPILRHISAIRGRLHADMRALHVEYGEAVRYGPFHVSFITAQAWKDIYRQLPKVPSPAMNKSDIIGANDTDHARFRKSLSRAFSAKGLQAQEPLLISYADKLIERLKGFAEARMPINMVKWYNLTTFDLIGDLAFGEPFGGLETSEYHHWVSTIFESIKASPWIMAMYSYPFISKAIYTFMPKSLLEAREKRVEHARMTVRKRLDNPPAHDRGDFMDSMLLHRGEKDGLTDYELEANANILIIAGSETTATLLSGVTYWLLRTPETLRRVTSEVRSTMKTEADITFNHVTSQLPYMLACLDEAFRLYPPVPLGLSRMPLTPTYISGYEIAPGTIVSVHQHAAYMSPTNFYDPDHFIPERWLPEAKNNPSSPFFSDNRDVLQPFSTGPRNCIGKNLAYAEMRVILARVLWNFDLQLCEESLDWKDQETYALWSKRPLMCKLVQRVGSEASKERVRTTLVSL